jgi:hypothetical protein
MQRGPDAVAVVENDQLPSMDRALAAVRGRGEGAVMSEPAPGDVMSEPAPGGGDSELEYPDMAPIGEPQARDAAGFAAGDQGEGYLRLVVAVENDRMSVVDASVVGGPLAERPDLTGEMVYEARVGGRRVGSEGFADLSEAHSLAPPDDPDRGHHFGKVKRFDFVVRIPRGEITQDDLSKLEIELYRPEKTTELAKDFAPPPGVTFERAAAARGMPEPRAVARLEGVDLQELPASAAEAIRKGLRR